MQTGVLDACVFSQDREVGLGFSSMKNRRMLSAVKLINSINLSLIGIIVLSKSIK
jgi:hypothetical protein